jgi:hypothetical protein
MLTKFHKVLLAALAVQLVLVVIVLSRGGDAVVKEHPIVAGFDAAKVTRVQVFAAADGKPIDLVKRDAGWVIASSYDYPVDAARVTDVLAPIAKASAAEPIATSAGRHKQLRVADGEFDRKLIITSGGKDLTLYLGGPAGARRNAVRIGGDANVYAVTGISAGAVGGEPRMWVDPAYVKVPRDEVARVTIARDGTSVELAKQPAAPAPAVGSDGVPPPPAPDRWTATIGGAAIALGKDETIDDAAIDRIVSAATAIDLAAPADPKRDAARPTATITIERKPAPAPAAGSGSGSAATPAPPAGPTVIDVIADGASYWVHDRSSPRAVLVDKARLEDVVTAGRDKLVKKPAPPAKQSASPGLPPGVQLPPGTELPPGVQLPGPG